VDSDEVITEDAWPDLIALGRANSTTALAVAGMPDDQVLQWWDDDGPRTTECMSVTKFVVAMALGLAVSTDDLQAPLRTWIDEWSADARGDITLTQVLTHLTGLVVSPPSAVYQATSVRAFTLASELVNNGRWAYNNRAFHLAGIVAERASGRPLDELAADGLFAPLGIDDFWWQRDPEGFPLCMAGLHLRATDLARIGRLHLTAAQHGKYQVLPADWLAAMPSQQGEVGRGCFTQYRDGTRVGFGHDGDLGQWIAVQPALGIVAVRTRTTTDPVDTLGWPTFPGDINNMFAKH